MDNFINKWYDLPERLLQGCGPSTHTQLVRLYQSLSRGAILHLHSTLWVLVVAAFNES